MTKKKSFKAGDKVVVDRGAYVGERLTIVDEYFSLADPSTIRWMCSFDSHPDWTRSMFYDRFLVQAKKQKPWWHKTTLGALAR